MKALVLFIVLFVSVDSFAQDFLGRREILKCELILDGEDPVRCKSGTFDILLVDSGLDSEAIKVQIDGKDIHSLPYYKNGIDEFNMKEECGTQMTLEYTLKEDSFNYKAFYDTPIDLNPYCMKGIWGDEVKISKNLNNHYELEAKKIVDKDSDGAETTSVYKIIFR